MAFVGPGGAACLVVEDDQGFRVAGEAIPQRLDTGEDTAGGELVTITMTGGAEIVDLQIKPEAVDPEDVETLQDLILAAYRDAHNKAGKLAEEKIAPLTGGALGGQQGGAPFGGQQAGPGEVPFGGII